jgi:hypothetical protein
MIVNISKVSFSLRGKELDSKMLWTTISKLASEVHLLDNWRFDKTPEGADEGKPSDEEEAGDEETTSSSHGEENSKGDDSKESSKEGSNQGDSVIAPLSSSSFLSQHEDEKNIVLDM